MSATVVQFPKFTQFGPRDPAERMRLAKLFAGKSVEEMRSLWDNVDDNTSFCGDYDCADIHGYMNMLGDGSYCAV